MINYDFHIHSALSPCGDNDMTPNNIVGMAKIAGLDAIAVSDHNTVGNVRAAMAVGERFGVTVIPGMEVETAEEIHILTLYPTIEAAEFAADIVYRSLPWIANKPEIFGEQRFMDCDDNITGYEEKLLLCASSLSIEDVFGVVKEAGGIFIPAHVDRHSYSILTNLGFMPQDIDIRCIEFSKLVSDISGFIESRPDLSGYKVFRNSDAHYLEDIAACGDCLELDSADELFRIV